ncbi:glycosyltransferase [Curtobacterium sp. MCPF17_050]|uniref:glycosyltransferase n=1 Tax=Curtobacterium sp. MCPF17_050 TaxID=2175664 RepID=UPI000D9B6270|nr:glycosyltransferase [Curtobacterium sp. MCPF17_050]WIB15954.1 glycosyltransferase [Curtobacterium sp. MCPF17_050]
MSGNGIIVHEWIERVGGAERVVDEFADLHPDADILTLWNDHPQRYGPDRVHETVLARLPERGRKVVSLPAMSAVWRTAPKRLGQRDWALVSSHLFAHHVRVPGVAPERLFVYAHTPARYIWESGLDDRGRSLPVRACAPFFRWLDRRNGATLQRLAVPSAFVRRRVERTWGVEAEVIHPPVDLARVRNGARRSADLDPREQNVLASLPQDFVLAASRFVPYKRIDVAITAGVATGRPVVIAGCGPDEGRLRALAAGSGAEVRFVIAPSDDLLACLLDRAAVFVFPAVEDFGIVPIEALAVGTPVVVADQGGTRESVSARSGIRIPDHEPSTLRDAVARAVRLDPATCRRDAEFFDSARFRSEITAWMAA